MTHVQDQYLKDRSQAKVIPALRKSKTTKILFCLYLIHFSLLLRSMNLLFCHKLCEFKCFYFLIKLYLHLTSTSIFSNQLWSMALKKLTGLKSTRPGSSQLSIFRNFQQPYKNYELHELSGSNSNIRWFRYFF